MAITDSWLKANHKKEHAKVTVKLDRNGLSVRVSPKGKITIACATITSTLVNRPARISVLIR